MFQGTVLKVTGKIATAMTMAAAYSENPRVAQDQVSFVSGDDIFSGSCTWRPIMHLWRDTAQYSVALVPDRLSTVPTNIPDVWIGR